MSDAQKTQIKRIYVDLPEVAMILSLSETTVQLMVREARFPAPRQLSGRRVGWLLREIEEWADNCPVSNLPPPANTGKRRATAAPTAPDMHPAL